MLLYYGCCHPSGPAPIPSQKPDFLKPGSLTFNSAPHHQYKPSMQAQKPQQDKQVLVTETIIMLLFFFGGGGYFIIFSSLSVSRKMFSFCYH